MCKRGDVYYANLNPQKGSEQKGIRPVLIIQIDLLNRVGNTVIVVPFTSNMKRANLPSCVAVPKGEGGLSEPSVALCHQVRVLDKSGLQTHIGTLKTPTLELVEDRLRFTVGI